MIQHLNLTNALLTFTDRTTPTPFHTVYGPTHLELKNLSTRPNEHGLYSIVAKTDDGESFAWSGTVSVRPPQSHGEFKLLGIPPAKYGPYLAHFTTAADRARHTRRQRRLRFHAAGFPPEVEMSNAAVHLQDFELQAPSRTKRCWRWTDLQVQNVSANLTNATVRVPLVKFIGGSVFIRRDADGQLEAEKYVFPPTNGFALIRQFASNLQPMVIADLHASLDELRVENFSVKTEDFSLPNVAPLGLDDLALPVKGVSNQTNAPVVGQLRLARWRAGAGRVHRHAVPAGVAGDRRSATSPSRRCSLMWSRKPI